MLGFDTEAEVQTSPKPAEVRAKRPPKRLRSERRLSPVVDGPLRGALVEARRLNNGFMTRTGAVYRHASFDDAEGRTRHYWRLLR